jgi:PAS domain S-box-containing protein
MDRTTYQGNSSTQERVRTILIVEDSLQYRKLLCDYLSQDNRYIYTIIETETGAEGLKQYRTAKPDAILLDYLLPDMNGLEFLHALQQQIKKPDLPVVLLTQYESEHLEAQAIESGAQQYLNKSALTTENLRLSLHNALKQGELLRQVAVLKQENQQHIKALNQQEEQLRLALASAQMGIWDWNLITGKVQWNREHEELFDLEPGSFDGSYEAFDQCIHPDDRAGVHQAVIESIENHTSMCHQFRIIWSDGSIHWIETRGEAYLNNAQQAIRTVGTVVNIDKQQQAQQLLQTQLDQQRLVLDMTVRIRRSLDLTEILQTTVDEVRQFLQIERVIVYKFTPNWSGKVIVESVGAGWGGILATEQIYNPFNSDSITDFQQGLVIANSDIYNGEIDDLHLQLLESVQVMANLVVPIFKGDELWGLLIAHHCSAPREWQISEIDLVKQLASQVSIAIQQADLFTQAQQELTQRKQAEMTLQLMNTELKQRQSVEKLKDEFIGIVSHELRTPLTSMQGSLSLLAMGLMDDEPEQMKQMIEIASVETERLVRMVNNILDLDKLEADATLEQEWCKAPVLIQRAMSAMLASAAAAGVDLEIDCPPIEIWVSPDRIIQTLTNLLGNALKFSPRNSAVLISVEVIDDLFDPDQTLGDLDHFDSVQNIAANCSRQIRFAIKDRGRGIPADKLETIFNRFQQVDASDSRDKGGTGLGLAICKSIVEQHHGRIWVESIWGMGSTFFFDLPQPLREQSIKQSLLAIQPAYVQQA